MTFSFEVEHNSCLSFLDVLVTRTDDRFITSLYRKPTFSGLYTHFNSFIAEQYKKGLIFCLLFRIFTFVTTWEKFHDEVVALKNIFKKNAYPEHFFDKCVKNFLDKKFKKLETKSDQIRELKISIPFMGSYSNVVKKQISKLASQLLVKTKITIIWKSPRKLRNLFTFKDRLPMRLRSKILYSYTCDGCNSIYIGKSKRHFVVRAYEHLGLSLRTGKKFTFNAKNSNNSNILEHINTQSCCQGNIANFKIVGNASNDYFLRIKKSLLIHKLKPTINSNEKSIPLQLF